MKFTTNKKALRDAVARVNAIVFSKAVSFGDPDRGGPAPTTGDHVVHVTADDLSMSYYRAGCG